MRWRLGQGCLLLSVLFAGCGDVAPRTATDAELPSATTRPPTTSSTGPARSYPVGSLPAFLAADGRFSTFLGLLERDEVVLEELLGEPDRAFTLFVPTDDAFLLLGPDILAAFDFDANLVTGIVERHFLAGRLHSDEFVTSYLFTGMSRRLSRILLILDGDRFSFGDARIIDTDIRVAGGIIHVIGGVNLGPTPDRFPVP